MHSPLNLEKATISTWVNHAITDLPGAVAILDSARVTADDFASPHLRSVWSAVETLSRDGRAPDFYAVEALVRGQVPRQMLVEVLLDCTDTFPAVERLRTLHDVALRRRATQALSVVSAVFADTSRPIADGFAEAQRALEALHQPDGLRTLDGEVIRLVDHLEEVAAGRRVPVLETGFDALDAVIGGHQPTLIVIGSLPGVGKSALLAGFIRNLVEKKVRVGLLSLEDPGEFVVRRLVAEASKVPVQILANKKLGPNQQQRVGKAVEAMYGTMAHVLVDDRSGLSCAEVVSTARSMLVQGAKILLIDHLGEIRISRTDRHDLDITEVLQRLRALAKTYHVPVVVLCHLRRRDGLTAKDEPRLTDFAFSSGVERMARVALALSRPSDETLRVHVLKQTQGIAGVSIELPFDGPAAVVLNQSAPSTRSKANAIYGIEETND